MQLSNISIGTRLKTGFAVVLALTMTLALVAWIQIQKIGDIVTEINDSWMVSVTQLNDMKGALSDMRRGELRYVLTRDPQAWDAEDALRAAAVKRFETASKPYEATGISGPPEQKIYDEFRVLLRAYQDTVPKLRELARGGDAKHEEAVAFLSGPSSSSFEAANAALIKDIEFNVKGSATMREKSIVALGDGALYLVLMLGTALALGAVFAWWLSRSIVLPLHSAIGAARVMASGDLSQPIEVAGTDEAGQLLSALADMHGKLRGTIAVIQQSADQVGTASAQIATGNSDLSERTEKQASNLQETAASIEELSATVVQGAQSAQQATQLAASAAQFAGQGGTVMGEVVDTMSGISTSSKRIADIISVIDGIAFQTNILALNAAVEAARAGEQGRGFAVVASEVRSLAKRSADAAKEIKGLIQDSVERVDVGNQLVQRAGTTMTDIVGAVRKVADLIGEVSAAAAEQTAGFRLISNSVTELDRSTQQNAALVEESAAAAMSLREQAQSLSTSVAQFRLGAN